MPVPYIIGDPYIDHNHFKHDGVAMTNVNWRWEFPTVSRTDDGQFNDVIRDADYVIIGNDGENEVRCSGRVQLDPAVTGNFVQYDQISNVLMAEWIANRFPELVYGHTTNIQFELRDQREGAVKTSTPPFSL